MLRNFEVLGIKPSTGKVQANQVHSKASFLYQLDISAINMS